MIAKADRPLKAPLSCEPRGPSLVNIGPCREKRATCQLSFYSKQCARYRVATSDGFADGLGNTRQHASIGIRDIPATLLVPTSWCLRLMHPRRRRKESRGSDIKSICHTTVISYHHTACTSLLPQPEKASRTRDLRMIYSSICITFTNGAHRANTNKYIATLLKVLTSGVSPECIPALTRIRNRLVILPVS